MPSQLFADSPSESPGSGNESLTHPNTDKTGQIPSALNGANCTIEPKPIEIAAIEIVEGTSAVDMKLRHICDITEIEVVSFQMFGRLTTEQAKTGKSRNAPMYKRGVTSRTIYLEGARNEKGTRSYVDWLNQCGSQVRTRPSLPIQMLISDQTTAVLPLDPSGSRVGIRVVQDPIIVAGLSALFEQTWLAASPLGLTLSSKRYELTDTHRAVLDMLSLGDIDKEIERKMAIDKRTVGRRVAEIMRILDAKTRFQAGAKAAKSGLI